MPRKWNPLLNCWSNTSKELGTESSVWSVISNHITVNGCVLFVGTFLTFFCRDHDWFLGALIDCFCSFCFQIPDQISLSKFALTLMMISFLEMNSVKVNNKLKMVYTPNKAPWHCMIGECYCQIYFLMQKSMLEALALVRWLLELKTFPAWIDWYIVWLWSSLKDQMYFHLTKFLGMDFLNSGTMLPVLPVLFVTFSKIGF